MDGKKIHAALADISAEQDPTLKSAKLASLCSALWGERGVELIVVGGSAIEILTEGAYASGDLDMCHANKATLPVAERKEVMGLLDAKGGPRNWQVAGMYLDLLGPVESFARTPYRRVEAPYGSILLMKPEDLLVEAGSDDILSWRKPDGAPVRQDSGFRGLAPRDRNELGRSATACQSAGIS